MKALIVYGGWDGHEPEAISGVFAAGLKQRGFEKVELCQTLEVFLDEAKLKTFDLLITHWTMGKMTYEQSLGLSAAVRSGVGFAGAHGGAGDAFRDQPEFQFMVGGQFVFHPPMLEYEVHLLDSEHPVTKGIKPTFKYYSEQYYMHIDPAIHVLADAPFELDGRIVNMPCMWTKTFGKGRVFYCALGHSTKEYKDHPHVLEMILRGMVWAAEGKKLAK